MHKAPSSSLNTERKKSKHENIKYIYFNNIITIIEYNVYISRFRMISPEQQPEVSIKHEIEGQGNIGTVKESQHSFTGKSVPAFTFGNYYK